MCAPLNADQETQSLLFKSKCKSWIPQGFCKHYRKQIYAELDLEQFEALMVEA